MQKPTPEEYTNEVNKLLEEQEWFSEFYTDFIFVVKHYGATAESFASVLIILLTRSLQKDTAFLYSLLDSMFRASDIELDVDRMNAMTVFYNNNSEDFKKEFCDRCDDADNIKEDLNTPDAPKEWGECPRQQNPEPDTNS